MIFPSAIRKFARAILKRRHDGAATPATGSLIAGDRVFEALQELAVWFGGAEWPAWEAQNLSPQRGKPRCKAEKRDNRVAAFRSAATTLDR